MILCGIKFYTKRTEKDRKKTHGKFLRTIQINSPHIKLSWGTLDFQKSTQNHSESFGWVLHWARVNKTSVFSMKGDAELHLLENFNYQREHAGKSWVRSPMEQAATTIILKMQWPQIPSWNETSIVENTLFSPMLLRSDDSNLLVLF